MKILIALVLIALWIYLLTVFRRADMKFFEFIFGSVGLFTILMIFVRPYAIEPITKMLCAAGGVIGNITGIFTEYHNYGMFFINNKNGVISLYLDYECSGVIESIAITSMLWFFPAYRFIEKVIVNVGALLWIFVANLIRIILICVVVYYFGPDYFYMAHTIIGRMVFYALSILMYFFVFTRTAVIRQKIGVFGYEGSN